MRNLLVLAVMFLGLSASAQWKTINVNDNPFEDPYTVAIVQGGSGYLKMEEADGKVYLFLGASYVCDDYIDIDLSFKIDGEWVRSTLSQCMVVKRKIVVFSSDLGSNAELLDNFKRSSDVAIRTKESHCDSDTFTFSSIGFSASYAEMSK